MNNKIEFTDFMKLAALVFFGLWFHTREEAEQHIIDDLQWIEDNNLIEDKHLTHEITEYQQEVNTKRDKNAMWVRLMHHYVGY